MNPTSKYEADRPPTEPIELPDVDPHAGDVDITLLWHMLSMTPAERLDFHDDLREELLALRRAGRKHYGITGYDEIDPQSAWPTDRPGVSLS